MSKDKGKWVRPPYLMVSEEAKQLKKPEHFDDVINYGMKLMRIVLLVVVSVTYKLSFKNPDWLNGDHLISYIIHHFKFEYEMVLFFMQIAEDMKLFDAKKEGDVVFVKIRNHTMGK